MKCPKCQFENPEGAKFCIECGHKFGEGLAIEGERKQVTVLFLTFPDILPCRRDSILKKLKTL